MERTGLADEAITIARLRVEKDRPLPTWGAIEALLNAVRALQMELDTMYSLFRAQQMGATIMTAKDLSEDQRKAMGLPPEPPVPGKGSTQHAPRGYL